MAVKAIINADEFGALPENMQEFYIQDGDSYRIDIDDAESLVDLSGLKNALERQKQDATKAKQAAAQAKSGSSELEQRLNSMEQLLADLGGQEGAEGLKKLREQIEADETMKLMLAGDYDSVRKRLIERNDKDWGTKHKAVTEALETERQKSADIEKRLSAVILENSLTQAAGQVLIPHAVGDAVLFGKQFWKVGENGQPELRKEDGELEVNKEGDPISMTDWYADMTENKPHWFAGHSGGGAGGGAGKGGRKPWQIPRSVANSDFQAVQAANNAAKEAGLSSFEIVEDAA